MKLLHSLRSAGRKSSTNPNQNQHTLETIIKKKNGVILDRNTDVIRYGREEAIDITHYYWDDEKTVLYLSI